MYDCGFLIRSHGDKKEVGQYFLNAERKELYFPENNLQEWEKKKKKRHFKMKKNKRISCS